MTQALFFPDRYVGDLADYTFDFAQYCGPADMVESAVITVSPSDLSASVPILEGNLVVVWLGEGSSGCTYSVSCAVTTAMGRSITRTASLYTVGR